MHLETISFVDPVYFLCAQNDYRAAGIQSGILYGNASIAALNPLSPNIKSSLLAFSRKLLTNRIASWLSESLM